VLHCITHLEPHGPCTFLRHDPARTLCTYGTYHALCSYRYIIMATTVGDLLAQHPVNPIHDTRFHTGSNKPWTKIYPPITKIIVRTRVQTVNGQQAVVANFDPAFLGEYHDDALRLNEPVYPPNYRHWRLQSEEDGVLWFHTEISNVVLAAWSRYPDLLQVSHEKPLSETVSESQVVDIAYSIRREGGMRVQIAIGEFKRGLIESDSWQRGKLSKPQLAFSQELRGCAIVISNKSHLP